MQYWSRRGIGIILNTEAFRMEVDCSRARAGSGIEGRVVVSDPLEIYRSNPVIVILKKNCQY